jgi:hypothetical protein
MANPEKDLLLERKYLSHFPVSDLENSREMRLVGHINIGASE